MEKELALALVEVVVEDKAAKEKAERMKYEAYRRVLDAYDVYVLKVKPVPVRA